MPPDQAALADAGSAATHANLANAIRFLAADAVQKANSGHPGLPMGMADVATVLFTRFLKFDAADPDWPDRDRFILSAGHGSMLLYALLYLTGYPKMSLEQIKNFRQLGAITAGHPEFGAAPGIEVTTGPLGQGLTMAAGFALAERIMNARFGDDLVDHHTYVIAGDGCLMEGISHEAISLAGHLRLSKLIVLFDDNGICIDGATDKTVSDDQLQRFEAYGWHVAAVDGHDPNAIIAAITAAKGAGRPSLIACKTVIGYGAPTKAGTAATHGAPLGSDEIDAAKDALEWPYEAFEVPDTILDAWQRAGSAGNPLRQAWAARLAAAPDGDAFTRLMAGELEDGWQAALADFKRHVIADAPAWATRKSSAEVLAVLNGAIPEMIGGSADLTGSNLTMAKGSGVITADDYAGKYIHYGVREFGMAAVMNGLALHGGVVPYGGTFLVFADYLRPALRLSALMQQRVIYVLTHDSIGLGEDGPTHQPVETLASLRAIPGVAVFRPADVVETAECWQLALERKHGPTVLALTRQGVPTLRSQYGEENLSARGAYIVQEADGTRAATILATGSEVAIALRARDLLAADGIAAAVVSMPSFELFDTQDAGYRASVLGADCVRVGIEAAIRQGWEGYISDADAFVGMTGFGASAPADELYAHFGITAEAVAAKVRERINS
jgi:transketolase